MRTEVYRGTTLQVDGRFRATQQNAQVLAAARASSSFTGLYHAFQTWSGPSTHASKQCGSLRTTRALCEIRYSQSCSQVKCVPKKAEHAVEAVL